jgi:hypothetical protein
VLEVPEEGDAQTALRKRTTQPLQCPRHRAGWRLSEVQVSELWTDSLVFEGSANLRSSDTLEQLTIFNDPALHSFHAAWMEELKSMPLKKSDLLPT